MCEILDFCTFMTGLCNAPLNREVCVKCGGTGYVPIMCCNGEMCGCRGMPVDFKDCDCGIVKLTNDQIKKLANP